jgi:hypothetical protein
MNVGMSRNCHTVADREPVHELPVDREDVAALREELRDPGAGSEHELLSLVRVGVGPNDHAVG